MDDFADKPSLNPHRDGMTRRYFLAGAMAATAGATLYGNEIGRHEIQVVERSWALKRLPREFSGYRVVQISDIHLDVFTEEWFLARILERVNRLKPDLVLVTGDFITRSAAPIAELVKSAERCATLLGTLVCKNRFGVLGNHDFAMSIAQLRGILLTAGLPLLVNECVPIMRGGAHFLLAGLDDCTYGNPNIAAAVPAAPGTAILTMVHEPDYVDTIAASPLADGIGLVLSGHTHGGQIRLPGLPPVALPPLGRLYPHGAYQVKGVPLYVNRGLGTVGIPVRLNCPPEITVFTLQPA